MPFGTIVVFLTINGVVISPVVYFLQLKPIADSKSTLTVLFRGANRDIRSSGTGNKNAGLPIVEGIDVDPDLSKTLPFTQDDIPITSRMGLTNLPWLSYLDKWLKTAKPFMGFP